MQQVNVYTPQQKRSTGMKASSSSSSEWEDETVVEEEDMGWSRVSTTQREAKGRW